MGESWGPRAYTSDFPSDNELDMCHTQAETGSNLICPSANLVSSSAGLPSADLELHPEWTLCCRKSFPQLTWSPGGRQPLKEYKYQEWFSLRVPRGHGAIYQGQSPNQDPGAHKGLMEKLREVRDSGSCCGKPQNSL